MATNGFLAARLLWAGRICTLAAVKQRRGDQNNIGQRERETGTSATEAREAVLEQEDVVAPTRFGRVPKKWFKSEPESRGVRSQG